MENCEDLEELLEAVTDADSFLTFVEALSRDRENQVQEQPQGPPPHFGGQGSRGWYNHTIEDFLEAAVAWGRSTRMGATQNLEQVSPWQRFALFLYCGKIYE